MGNVALILSMALFFYALRIDIKYKKNTVTWASFVPLIWLALKLSRKPSRWFNVGSFDMVRTEDYVSILEKGNRSDQIILASLFAIAVVILFRRRKKVARILRDNKIWLLLVTYCMASIIWSEAPFISLRRFVKDLNAFLMVLIILTENSPFETFKAIVRRNIYLLIPLSIAFCKYFPAIGRYQTSSWHYIYTGVATHKNSLGILCLITIFILFLEVWPHIKSQENRIDRKLFRVCLLYIGLAIYLLGLANSMTANVCLVIGLGVYMSKFLKKRLTLLIVMVSICYLTGIDEYIINSLKDAFLGFVGRGQTITGRMDLWEVVLGTEFNRLVGTGYSAFWLGERMREIIERFIFIPKQAHNGYIEIYINLGLVGLSIFFITLLSTYKKIKAIWSVDNYRISFSLAFTAMYMIYNMTEATFIFNASPLWFMFVYIAFSHSSSVDAVTDPDNQESQTQT